MIKKNKLVLIVTISIVLISVIIYFLVQGVSQYINPSSSINQSKDYDIGIVSEPMFEDEIAFESEVATEDSVSESTDKKLIKTGSLSMSVDDLEETGANIKDLAVQYDGYISNLYVYGVDNDKTYTLTLRIPVYSFDPILSELENLAHEITSSKQSTNDVTEQYVDLQGRLKNKRSVENQYVELLDKAVDVEDMLLIQEQLGYVRGEIESLEGQIKYLDSQTEYSTISITLSLSSEGVDVVDNSWDPLGTVKDAANSFVGVLRASGDIIIWVVVFSPVVIIPWILVRVGKRNKK